MKYNYRNYTIEIIKDSSYSRHSADNINSYSFEYPERTDQNLGDSYTTKIGILLKEDSEIISSAIICEPNGITIESGSIFVIKENSIFICAKDYVYSLNIPDLTINWRKRLDFSACVAIYNLENDLLIHGELEMKRIDYNGNVKWGFSGHDIWVNTDGKETVKLEEDCIKLVDFNSEEYVIDFNGVPLS